MKTFQTNKNAIYLRAYMSYGGEHGDDVSIDPD